MLIEINEDERELLLTLIETYQFDIYNIQY